MILGEVNTQILILVMLDGYMYYTLPQFLSNSFKILQLLTDQLESQKPADLVLHCFKTGYIKSLAWKRVY